MTPSTIALGLAVPVVLALAGMTYGPKKIANVTSVITTSTVTEWEHGWKTDRVIATRYKNPTMGYNIGFTFPKNPNDCDRAELSDFMDVHGGGIYQSGGHPGAEMFVRFKDVTDKETANVKIKEILPALSQLITDLGSGAKVKVAGVAKLQAEREARSSATTLTLKDQATSLVPVVQGAQSKRLTEFMEKYEADVAAWSLEAERFGDFLTIKIARRYTGWSEGKPVQEIAKSVVSINLKEAPIITVSNGRKPDLAGCEEFYEQNVLYEGEKEWTKIVSFPGVDLSLAGAKKQVGSGGMVSVNGYQTGGLGITVNGIARPGQDDKIVFGAGGGRPIDDWHGSGMRTVNDRDYQLRPGATISVPAGLGETVHRKIMEAIERGAQ